MNRSNTRQPAAPCCEETSRSTKRLRTASTVVSGVATAAGLALVVAGAAGVVPFAIGVVAGAWHVVPKAMAAARRARPDMNLLMFIAIAGAAAIGEWFEASTVAFLYSLSLSLEAWSVGRARRAVEKLLDLAPRRAHVIRDEGVEDVDAAEVPPASRILVRPGERVPLDGEVVSGTGHIDESLLTGESLPVLKGRGDPIFAGTINGEGALEVRTKGWASASTVAHIAKLVESAAERRSRSELWVERFARVYTPVVLALAVLVMSVPPVVTSAAWSVWLYRGLVLLVIACPCALVISTPISIVSGLACAARNGVLVKEGRYLEAPGRIRTVAFDKTGTLTEGKPKVVEIVPLQGHSDSDLLARAAALERASGHPLARAVVEAAIERGVTPANAHGVRAIHGKGVEGTINGRTFWIGSHRWLEERGDETPDEHKRLEALSGPGRSVMVVGNDRHVCGMIAVKDAIRPEAAETVRSLRDVGVGRIVMLTGDNQATALAIAATVGIEDVQAELLPSDKIYAVERLGRDGGHVLMVGDGVNDAPALARADLGIAMAAAGNDAAVEAADIALMGGDLRRLPWLFRHSRRTLAMIRQNILIALATKSAFVVLTLVGGASLWAAIAADMGASLVVVFNALRLLRTPAGSPA